MVELVVVIAIIGILATQLPPVFSRAKMKVFAMPFTDGQKPIILRKQENIRMSCVFCQGRVEFPPHEIGIKMACPHTDMDITLKESAGARCSAWGNERDAAPAGGHDIIRTHLSLCHFSFP